MYHDYLNDREIIALKKYAFFEKISYETLEKLFKYMSKVNLSKNSTIYREGEKARNLYFIKEGQVEISKRKEFAF